MLNFLVSYAAVYYQVTMPNRLLAVHGGLMVLAFVILLPLGLLASRHKWLFVDEEFVSGGCGFPPVTPLMP
jgi:hypothetical protein